MPRLRSWRDALILAFCFTAMLGPVAAEAANPLSLTIRPDKTRPVNPQLLGFMQDSPPLAELSYPAFFALDEVRRLPMKTVRFPGGTEANFYHWATDRFDPKDLAPFPMLAEPYRKAMFAAHGPAGRPIGFDDFISWAAAQQKSVVFTLNLLTENSPADALRQLARAQAKGVAIRYVELGNELYYPDAFGAAANPKDMAAKAARFAQAVREAFPQCRIGVPVANTIGNNVFDSWDRAMASLGPLVDAYILHIYPEPKAPAAGYLESNAHRAVTHDLPRSLAHYSRLFPGKSAWITEWNYGNDPTPQLHNSPYGVLFMAQMFLAMMQRPEVELAMLHRIVGPTHSLVAVEWPKGQVSFRPNLPYPFWLVLGQAYEAAHSWAPIEIDYKETGSLQGRLKKTTLEGIALLGAHNGTFVILNLGNEPVSITLRMGDKPLSGITGRCFSAASLLADPQAKTAGQPKGASPAVPSPSWPAGITMQGHVLTLPAHSIFLSPFGRANP